MKKKIWIIKIDFLIKNCILVNLNWLINYGYFLLLIRKLTSEVLNVGIFLSIFFIFQNLIKKFDEELVGASGTVHPDNWFCFEYF